ncbi:MAG: DUF5671 domain-containing protein [Caldilinea sp.]|nr:DUF5671 domain-containing protein [Caldilinea sp.]
MTQATMQTNDSKATRLVAVRRFYVYLVAFVSQIAMLVGMNDLIDIISRAWLQSDGLLQGAFVRTATARSIGLLIVATPLFLVHWWLAQRHREEVEERSSVLRKLFLYGSTAAGLVVLLTNGYRLIRDTTWLAFGAPMSATELPAGWLHWGFMAAIGVGLVYYWYTVLVADDDFGHETGLGRFVRQLFLSIAGLIGLGIAMWGARTLIELGLQVAVDQAVGALDVNWWRLPLGGAMSQILVGLWLVHATWAQWQEIVKLYAPEGRAVLRRIYLYVGIVAGAVATLTPAALLLREGLLILLGTGGGSTAELLDRMVGPVSFIPVGAVVWTWYWRTLRRETDAYGDSGESATVRRIYAYLVAATGLGLLWVGAVELLHALIDAMLVGDIWHEPLANGIALLAVGAPIWAIFWRRVQRIAERADAEGAAERDSWPRKLYLYGVALVGALVLLVTLAQVIYRVLLTLLGEPGIALSSNELAHQLADSAVAAVLWGVHLWAIRQDGRYARPSEAVPAAAVPLSVEEQRAMLEAQIAQLEQQLAAARAELEGLGRDKPV